MVLGRILKPEHAPHLLSDRIHPTSEFWPSQGARERDAREGGAREGDAREGGAREGGAREGL